MCDEIKGWRYKKFPMYTCRSMKWFVHDICHKYYSWYFKVVSNFTHLKARKNTITILKYHWWNGIITNHAITYTNLPVSSTVGVYICCFYFFHLGSYSQRTYSSQRTFYFFCKRQKPSHLPWTQDPLQTSSGRGPRCRLWDTTLRGWNTWGRWV